MLTNKCTNISIGVVTQLIYGSSDVYYSVMNDTQQIAWEYTSWT